MSEFQGEARSFAVDVENMKVIEIKKRLKALGLPVTGNKPELVERLHLALLSGRDDAASPDSACDSNSPNKMKDHLPEDTRPSSEVMFEENEDLDQIQVVGQSEDLDESENYDESEDFAHSEEVGQNQAVHIVSTTKVPSIKRALPQEEVETVKPRKKIVLKRNNFPTPILAAKIEKAEEEEVSQSCDIAAKSSAVAGASTGSDKNVIKLTTAPYKGLSERDKQEKRAIRFNMSCEEFLEKSIAEIDKDKNFASTLKLLNKNKKKPFSRPQQSTKKTEKLSGFIPAPNIDVLRKRAERFGENVSSVLKKMEVEEKLKQRKMKFGQVLTGTKLTDEEEKKKKRAERFGK